MISFQSVTKLYGIVNGVNDVKMEIGTGAYGLLGPNGSGKTTLINLITGQLRPTIGSVSVFGEDPWGKQQMLSRIGLCPAVDVLYSNVSAFEWVNYQTRLIGYPWSEAKKRTENALSMLGMADAMHRQIGGYSLGMRQRTKLAQAIAHEPDLLILDEPFNGLDPIGRQQMTAFLREYVEKGKSVILASHVLHEVEDIQPTLLLLSNGRLLAQGSPKEIRDVLASGGEVSELEDSDEELATGPSPVRSQRSVEVFIRCNDNYLLAQRLMTNSRLRFVQLSEDESELSVGTSQADELLQLLPKIAASENLRFYEFRSADGSLDDLFSSLMKMHRGES